MTSPTNLAKKVERFSDTLDEAAERGVGSGMATTKREAKRNVRRNDSDVSGTLRDSIVLDDDGVTDLRDSLRVAAHARVSILAKYAPFVEYGTGTRQDVGGTALVGQFARVFKSPDPAPPFGRILQWIIRKGISANDPELRRTNRTQNETFTEPVTGETIESTAEQRRLAFAIRNSIANYGNRPHPFARPAARVGFDTTTRDVKSEFRTAIRQF
jgi:hypothetical protein